MSKAQSSLAIILPHDGDVEQVEQFLISLSALENVHRRMSLLCQAAQGACLHSLHQQYGFSRGHHGTTKATPCGFSSWTDFVKAKFGFSDEKARRLMAVCDGILPRLKNLTPKERERIGEFLGRPMLHLTEPEVAVLEKITEKITDAETQRGFLAECGFIKQDHGHALTNGNNEPATRGGKKVSDEKQLELFIQDFIFIPLKKSSDLIKAWHKPKRVGKTKVPAWAHMTVAQKKAALKLLEPLAKDVTAMRDELKEALGHK